MLKAYEFVFSKDPLSSPSLWKNTSLPHDGRWYFPQMAATPSPRHHARLTMLPYRIGIYVSPP